MSGLHLFFVATPCSFNFLTMETKQSTDVLPISIDFAKEEEKTLAMWRSIDAFQSSLKLNEKKPAFTFYDGPPFATGLPHYGHILAGTIKDTITRFQHMKGHHVERRFGWDCHGLPVEYEIDKKLGITGPDDITGPNGMGIRKYNEECRSIVSRYSTEWREIIERMGRWIDFDNDYKTMEPWYMESVWWVFKQIWDKQLVYQSFKVMPYSTACCTPLSNFEAQQNYKDNVIDPAVVVTFPFLDGEHKGSEALAWTTTPWTLPSNLALCVHPTLIYVKFKDLTGKFSKEGQDRTFIMGKDRICQLYPKYGSKKYKGGEFEILAEFNGASLKGMTYQPLFDYFASRAGMGSFQVCVDEYVTAEDGTCIVHQAPAFGEDDFRVCMAHGVIVKGENIPCPLDASAKFTAEAGDYKGLYIKDADEAIMAELKSRDRLAQKGNINHRYPYCWRSDTPLIYRIVPSWFIEVTKIKDNVVANNRDGTKWVPPEIGTGRFHNWLANARDWAVSRNRYWGTPIPIWISDDGEETKCIGSIEELETLSGQKITDLHRENIDHIEIPSSKGDGSTLKRVKVVFDCWFESGSMPYAQQHYPFENKEKLENGFPADFIAEGLDQTRGWFYTLMVLSTALFNKPAFKNLIVNGLVLAADGKKMSKRLKNYPAPTIVVNECGADALRMYLVNSPVVRAQEFKFKAAGVKAVVRDMLQPWYSALRMLDQNVQRLNKELGSTFKLSCATAGRATNVLDVWVNGELQKLVHAVHTEVGGYRLYAVLPNLVTFINDLNNWYIRLNRGRLKGSGGVEDCKCALSTLYKVLLRMCKILAPFTPFFTEFVFQHLKKIGHADDFVNHGDVNPEAIAPGPNQIDSSASVHFYPMPEAETNVNDSVLLQVAYLQKIIECGRLARSRAGEKYDQRLRNGKCPIKEIVIVHADGVARDAISNVTSYIATELNCKNVRVTGDELEWCTFAAIPNMKAIGKRFGKDRGSIIAGLGLADPNAGKKKKKKKKKKGGAAVEETKEAAPPAPAAPAPQGIPHAQMMQFESTGEMTIAGHVLTKAEVDVKREPKAVSNFQGVIVDSGRHADTNLVVFVSMEVDDASVKDMLVREIMSSVNRLRKAGDLVARDRIRVFYEVDASSTNPKAKTLVTEAMAEQLAMVEAKLSAPVVGYDQRQTHMLSLAEDKMDVFGYKINVSISKQSVSFPTEAKVLVGLFKDSTKAERQVNALKDYVAMVPYNEVSFDTNLTVQVDGESVVLVPGTHFFAAPKY